LGEGQFQITEHSVKVLFPKSEVSLELKFVEVSRVSSRQGSVVCRLWYVCEDSGRVHIEQHQQGQFFFVVDGRVCKCCISRISSAVSFMVMRSFGFRGLNDTDGCCVVVVDGGALTCWYTTV
jgi:hypothetical protein